MASPPQAAHNKTYFLPHGLQLPVVDPKLVNKKKQNYWRERREYILGVAEEFRI